MGNVLCKERVDRASDSKNPIDRVIGRCAQLCPNAMNRKNGESWNKHIYETRPQQSQPTKLDAFNSPTLKLEDRNLQQTIRPQDSPEMDPVPPVAPPRKKRPSMLSHDGRRVKNGFKDVFGGDTPRRFSCDSLDNATKSVNVEVSVPLKQSQSYDFDSIGFTDFGHDQTPTSELDRKVLPRVGNKKSDKFFGENLSDCLSDEYMGDNDQKQPDAIEKFVEENATSLDQQLPAKEKLSKSNSLDKKAEFLMAMLDGYSEENDEHLYAGRAPVEEPIIVPKRKPNKHVCDDDDHMHHRHSHRYEHVEPKKSDSLRSVPGEVGPKKPERDMAKYRRSMEVPDRSSDQEVMVEKPARKKKSLSRENLPQPPPRPAPPADMINRQNLTPPPVSPKPKTMKKIPSMPNNLVLSFVDKSNDCATKRDQLQKCQSSGALIPEEWVSEIKRKVYEFQMSQEYLPEDMTNQHDGSDLVRPQSRLEKRKVSVTKKISNASSIELGPILDEEPIRMKFSIGNSEVKITEDHPENLKETSESNHHDSKIVDHPSVSSEAAKKDIIHSNTQLTKQKGQKVEDDLEKILKLDDFNVNAISNVLDDIYANNKSILDDFQSFLENETDSLDDFEIVNLNEDPAKNSKMPEISVEVDGNKPSTPVRKQSWSSDGSISDDNYTDIIKDTPKEKVRDNTLLALAAERGRRESINDVDNWFENHIETPLGNPNIQNLLQEARKGRRGSDFMVGYDTTALYPFGSQQPYKRHGSESDTFLTNLHLSKSSDNVTTSDAPAATEEDHSNLLKFLKNEASAERAKSVLKN
ncbi:hypothetical protein DMENIID0001_138690 [Sergentomyia squamirostris]